jgi:ABC-type dipeptide/oligopeptide/nickel transport system permease component
VGFALTFFVRRLSQGVFIVLLVSFTIFALLRVVPGDPARIILGSMATDEVVEQTAREMGLRDPIPVQYMRYLSQVAQGDFGTSFIKARSGGFMGGGRDEQRGERARVIDLIVETLPYTLLLAGMALVFTAVIALPLGIAGGLMAGRWPDKLALYMSSIFVSMPNFWLAIVLALVVTAKLGWIPSIGYQNMAYAILPAFVIAIEMSPLFIRALSVSIADTLRNNFVELAQVRGISRRTVIVNHVLRNASIPVLNLFGVQIGALLGGVLIVEFIFDYPGFGLLTVQAVLQRDFPVIQGIAIVSTSFFVFINILVDFVSARIDPRIEY